jgi:hypothetical protein
VEDLRVPFLMKPAGAVPPRVCGRDLRMAGLGALVMGALEGRIRSPDDAALLLAPPAGEGGLSSVAAGPADQRVEGPLHLP